MGRSVTVQARAVARRRSAIQFNTLLHHNIIRPRGLALPRPDSDSAGRECRGTEERESAGRRAYRIVAALLLLERDGLDLVRLEAGLLCHRLLHLPDELGLRRRGEAARATGEGGLNGGRRATWPASAMPIVRMAVPVRDRRPSVGRVAKALYCSLPFAWANPGPLCSTTGGRRPVFYEFRSLVP